MSTPLQFDKKTKRLSRKHRRMARGAIASVNHDGLIIARPRRRASQFPIKGILLSIAALFFFKAYLLAADGPITYNDRVADLQQMSIVGQVGAFVMQADPLTTKIASYMGRLI